MNKTTTIFKQKTITCFITLCALLSTYANATPYDSGIENKSSQFNAILDDTSDAISGDEDNLLAEKIRQQRAALNAQSARDNVATTTKRATSSGKNECDQKLRACMKSKCGEDYSKCAGDTDTSWGNKMDLCRQGIKCTGEEYKLFTTEIKADRDMNARLASYTSIINCGNEYNNCIITECGKTLTKCLGKSAGDTAVQKCSKIANKCKEQDSGLSSRTMEAFGNLRGNAEKAIARDEKRLYELRDAMRETCDRLGAMFDERSLDCVYTVNFYAGEDSELYASRKAYAGSTFNCTQEWFGVDITTFMENAFRLTRAQSSASSAALGAGVGTAVGSITSGAIGRAIDTAKAERALGEELCTTTGGTWQKAINKCKCADTESFNEETGCADDQKKIDKANKKATDDAERAKKKEDKEKERTQNKEDKEKERTQNKEDKEKVKALCEQGGKWVGGICYCTDKTHTFDETQGCTADANKVQKQQNKNARRNERAVSQTERAEEKAAKKNCEAGGNGTWKDGKCSCKQDYTLSGTHCIETSVKTKVDAENQKKLNESMQKFNRESEEKLNAKLEASNKQAQDTLAAKREKSRLEMICRMNGTWANDTCTCKEADHEFDANIGCVKKKTTNPE